MRGLILRRLLQLPLILAVIFTVTLSLVWIAPGDPLTSADARRVPEAVLEAKRRKVYLHDPLAFAGAYMRAVFVGRDGFGPGYLGPSLVREDQSVNAILSRGLPYSMALGAGALGLALLLGVGAGAVGALRPGSAVDLASLGVAVVGVSLPSFVTATVLLGLSAALLGAAPIGGWAWPGWAVWEAEWFGRLREMLLMMGLPAFTLALAPAAYIARLIRLGLADAMGSDFVRTARAKGVSPGRVLMHHALKVAFLPVLSFLGPAAAATMTGSFVIEQVFEIPGIGREFVIAVIDKDTYLLLGVVLVYSTLLVVFNLVVDAMYAWIDPRIELEGAVVRK